MTFKTKSPAKINLGLQVLDKRPDGYHNINTIFKEIDLCDEISITQAESFKITMSPDLKIPIEDNLIYKAYAKLRKKSRLLPFVNIHVDKFIPDGGGMGGGSSNAASVLNALNHQFDLKLSYSDLHIIAQSIGSDIPFFLQGQMALASGRGEKLAHFELDLPFHYLIVCPNLKVSTPLAYKLLNRTIEEIKPYNFYEVLKRSLDNPSLLREHIVNDFEQVVFKEHKELSQIKKTLYDAGALLALMSGSGSTMFGIFLQKVDAEKAKAYFLKYKTYICK